MTGEVKLLPEEEAFAASDAVLAEMRRINDVCHPSYATGDREDLITYAKEVVALRARSTLVTGQLQEDGGELVERVARAIDPESWQIRDTDLMRRRDWDREIKIGWGETTFEEWANRFVGKSLEQAERVLAAIAATRAESETPTPGLTDDVVKELVAALPAEDCVICGKPKSQHSMSSGYGVCQIYPVFVSKREIFECLVRLARTGVTLK